MVTYRSLTPDEMPTAVRLWVDVFGVEEMFFQSLLAGDENQGFSVGAFEDGKLVSSVHVFMRGFRNLAGEVQKVGGIGSVSTLPEARSKGHSSRLLQMAIEEMAARDCIWSYLGTGVNDHYARHGWRTVSTPLHRGRLDEAVTGNGLVPTPVTSALLGQMADIHRTFFATTPMSNVRSTAQWEHAVRYRITRPEDAVYTATEGDTLQAYLVARRSDGHLELVEAACVAGAEDALRGLVRQELAGAAADGYLKVSCMIPPSSPAFAPFAETCAQIWPAEERGWMVRPIADRISWSDLMAIHASWAGRRSDLDNF